MTRIMDRRISCTLKATVVGFFITLCNSAVAVDELVGSDGGSFSVGNSGQAAWSMPIEVPSGINGLAPQLTVSVSTSGGNGSLGVGGGLSGLSSISRCGRTIYQDGYFQAPQYEQSDAYCLDGARLVLESGTYGDSGSIYRTEIESFQRVKAHGDVAGKGPAYFEVTNRAGATLIYGQNDGTKDVDPVSGAAAEWKIDQLIDSNENTLRYHYGDVSGNDEIQLTKITYGGNGAKGVTEHLAVELIYEDRPDTSSVWSRGRQYNQSKRVQRIITKVGSEMVRTYWFAYHQGEVSGASKLRGVQMAAGNGDAYRPTKFEYVPETQSDWQTSSLSLPAQLQTADGKPLGSMTDINNDGKADWVSANKSATGVMSLITYLGTSSGWSESADFKLEDVLFDYSQNDDGFATGLLLDVNGDGWPDYVQAFQTSTGDTLQTWRNNGATFVRDETLDLPVALLSLDSDGTVRSLADVADLNGDGLVDVIQSVTTSTGSVKQAWIQSAVYDEANGRNVHSWSVQSSYAPPSIGVDYTQGAEGRLLAIMSDVNADGLNDWVQSYRLNGVTNNVTWLNNGLGFEASASSQFSLPSIVSLFNYDIHVKGVPEYTFSDINGDGLPDLFKSMNLKQLNGTKEYDTWLNSGTGWDQNSAYNLPNTMFRVSENGNVRTFGGLVDLNSDGHPDFVRSAYAVESGAVAEEFYLFDKTNQSWVSTTAYSLPFVNNQMLSDGTSFSTMEVADINHDGYPELINTLTGDVYETTNGGDYPGTLLSSKSSLGVVTKLKYGIANDSDVYELSEQTPYPNVAYNAPVRVVTTIAVSTGLKDDPATSNIDESMISAHHKYGKAKTNLLGQGGLGYQYHSFKDGNSGVEVVASFHQDYPYAGRIKASSRYLNGTLLSMSNSDIEPIDITINGLTTRHVHPNSSIVKSYDADGTLLKTTRSSSTIDGYGNTKFSTEEIYDASDNLVRRGTTKIEYKAPDSGRWLFGLPEKTTQTLFDQATNETYTNVSTATFYPDGKPWTETLEPDSTQWVKTTYEYTDGFGNRTSTSVAAAGIIDERISTITFTPDGRFPVKATNALDHEVTSEFDPVLGKPNWVKDANDLVKEFVYDGFGTVIKETKAHQNNGATRGRQIVLPKWCDESADTYCQENGNAVYFIAAFDDEGEAPEIAYYDVNGKELRKQTYGFEGKIIVVETQYDSDGRVIKASQPYFAGEETATWTEYKYDAVGRQYERKNAENEIFYTNYDSFEVSTTNPGNEDTPAQTTRVINNIFGQPIQSIDPDSNSTFYEYDGRGKLVKTTDAHGNVATIFYDDIFGRKIGMDDPDLGVWSYTYDSLGNLKTQKDANGFVSTLKYDSLNRLVERIDGDREPGDNREKKLEVSTWDYSEVKAAGQLIGGLVKVTSPNYERTVKYDDFGRVNEATSIIDGESFTQRTGYLGTADKVDWIEYPSGLSVRNTYDEYGFPKTVEGIELDFDKYLEFQAASSELTKLQRDLEAYKDDRLSDAELIELENNEREVRRLGAALAEFYESFDDHLSKQEHEAEANRYTELIERVEEKITQHSDWNDKYQAELTVHYNRIKDDLKRSELIPGLSKPFEEAQTAAAELHESYAAKVVYYANKMNLNVNQINSIQSHNQIDFNAFEAEGIHAQNHLNHVHNHIRALFIASIANIYISHPDVMADELDNHFGYVFNNYVQPDKRTDFHVNFHLNEIANSSQSIANHQSNQTEISQRIDQRNIDIERLLAANVPLQSAYNTWESRRATEEAKIVAAAKEITTFIDEIEAISARIKPDLDRINDWLSPIVQSHSNVTLSFYDRAQLYVKEISQRTGTYAKRDDLKSEKFLRPFKSHVDYLQCLRSPLKQTMGWCYAQNLVHVLNDDGTVNQTKQDEARNKVEADTVVDVTQLYSNRRFFCNNSYGYSCPTKYATEIDQLAKAVHIEQCARMTDLQKEKSSVTCDSSLWNSPVEFIFNPILSPVSVIIEIPYLKDEVLDVSSTLDSYYEALVAAHEAEVARLVTVATQDTYNQESDYNFIVLPGGDLWQASTPTEVADGEADPRDYVLIHKGSVQKLADQEMSSLQHQANRDLKSYQQQVSLLINDGGSTAYDELYLAVQNQSAEVERLYKEIDQAYANASDDDDFDDNAFDEAKKVYWQAEDINSKGQIKRAKYGNNTTTEWTYDQFGRISAHLTKNASNVTLLNNDYTYDAIGNLTERHDYVEDLIEEFSYDVLNRLVQNKLTGSGAEYIAKLQQNEVNYKYDELGNLEYKSDIAGGGDYGRYHYDGVGPHAVTSITGLGSFTYDNNGNQISGNGRTITYNAFNKPTLITKDGQDTLLLYGPERQLIQQTENTPNGLETKTYVGGLFEQVSIKGGSITNRHQISVAGNVIAIVDTKPGSLVAVKESYLHKNHQGSVLAISDMQGEVAERRYYDAFGDMKNHIGQASRQYTQWLNFSSVTDLGFTGHKTLISAGVIHMGGRVYDAAIGRFLSADPHIQSPLNSQSLNRYSYTLNNPLSWTDPSGYFFKSIFKALKKLFDKIRTVIKKALTIIKKHVNFHLNTMKKITRYVKKYARVIVAVVVAVVIVYFTAGAGAGYGVALANGGLGVGTSAGLGVSMAAGAAAGAASGLIMTGSLKGALEGAFFGAITAGFASGLKNTAYGVGVTQTVRNTLNISYSLAQKIVLTAGHGVIGGLRAVRAGGKFLTGFVTGAISKAVTFGTSAINALNDNPFVQGLVVATAGGLTSLLAGGSFELGFLTAGLAFATNQFLTRDSSIVKGALDKAKSASVARSRGVSDARGGIFNHDSSTKFMRFGVWIYRDSDGVFRYSAATLDNARMIDSFSGNLHDSRNGIYGLLYDSINGVGSYKPYPNLVGVAIYQPSEVKGNQYNGVLSDSLNVPVFVDHQGTVNPVKRYRPFDCYAREC